MSAPACRIRPAAESDVEAMVGMVYALAEHEGLLSECVVEIEALQRHLFGPHPSAEALIADVDAVPVAFALFFPTFSTFLGKPGLWLEDLYVMSEYRHLGIGQALLAEVAQLATERDCGRVEWSVLDWNQRAVSFYHRFGADLLDGWNICRLDGARLAAFGDARRGRK